MEEATSDPDVTRRANELYWGSDESVNQIAERLDLSKSGLYGMVGPLMSGHGCPACGTEVEFANRTARDRDELECPACDWEGGESETAALDSSADESAWPPSLPTDGEGRRALLGGVLLGAAAGLLLFGFTRRRS
ncbi:MAG: hypothetical protein WD101_01845 [Gemmatimonadota bacterium]